MTHRSAPDISLSHTGQDAPERLLVGQGDAVGVVLLGLGGPATEAEVERYLFDLLMDPLRVRLRWLPRVVRRQAARFLARRRSAALAHSLRAVGGAAPELRLLAEQARALETELKRHGGAAHGVSFHVYASCRYGRGCHDRVIAQMRSAGVTRVVLVPTAPVRLSALTDTCVAAWQAAAADAEFSHVPSVVVGQHAGSPLYMQALSDRVDEALQRFPRALRDDVAIIYALHPAAALDAPDGSPERTPLASLVSALQHQRVDTRTAHLAYVQNWGLRRQPVPLLLETIERITAAGGTGIVVVPVGFSTETMETAYELDIVLRERAEEMGLQQYEIAAALNCNALYLQALAQAVGAHLRLGDVPGDGVLVPLPETITPTTRPRA